MSRKNIFEYARLAAEAEKRILELLDAALQEEPARRRSERGLRKNARPRQGEDSSG